MNPPTDITRPADSWPPSSAAVQTAVIDQQIDDLVTRILENIIIHSRTSFSDDEILSFRNELERAVEFTRKAHQGQVRKSGEPYVFHPLQVALEMSDNHMGDLISIVGCLLHDVVEDTPVTEQEIEREFGVDVLNVVDGLTKIKKSKIDTFDKFFSLSLRHPRILFIKIFDRLHNMRTIASLPPEKQAAIARETMDIFFKICRRLSLMDIADELELLCNRILQPEKVTAYAERIRELKRAHRQSLDEIVTRIGELGRKKALPLLLVEEYWKPFVDVPNQMYERLSTSEAFRLRVIMKEKYSAYTMMGVINEQFTHVRSSIYDYISVPRYNNHRSLRFDILDRGMKIPMAITTEAYHRFNRKGILTYGFSEDAAKNLLYMKHLEAYLREETDFRDIEQVFAYHNPEEIKVLSKDGKPFDMERESTALDFAFKIHSEIGIRAVSAIIDGRPVPIETRLADGNQIAIVTAEEPALSAASLDKCMTLRAKRLIANYLNRMARQAAAEFAKSFLEQNLFRYQVDVAEFWTRFRSRYDETEQTNLLLGILEDKKRCDRLILDMGLINRRRLKDIRTMESNFLNRIGTWFSSQPKWQHLRVPYLDNAVAHCPACMPVLKDSCSGLFQENRITVHRSQCPQLKNLNEDQTFLLKWKSDKPVRVPVSMQIRTAHRYGIGNDITAAFHKSHVGIEELLSRSVQESAMFDIRVEECSEEDISRLIEKLRQIPGVHEVRFRVR